MNRIFLFLLPCFILGFTFLESETDLQSSNNKIVTGYISEGNQSHHSFFIQDLESGDVIELDFENEILSQLTFEDFDSVEITGLYNSVSNILTVEEIIMSEDVVNNNQNKL